MKKYIKTVYFCEHCGKHNLSASAISRHEKYCRYNPQNKHKCFQMCVHLKHDRIAKGYHYAYTEFTCKLTGQKMYSYYLEKVRRSGIIYPPIPSNTIRMPLDCADYKEMTFEEQEARFQPKYYESEK